MGVCLPCCTEPLPPTVQAPTYITPVLPASKGPSLLEAILKIIFRWLFASCKLLQVVVFSALASKTSIDTDSGKTFKDMIPYRLVISLFKAISALSATFSWPLTILLELDWYSPRVVSSHSHIWVAEFTFILEHRGSWKKQDKATLVSSLISLELSSHSWTDPHTQVNCWIHGIPETQTFSPNTLWPFQPLHLSD